LERPDTAFGILEARERRIAAYGSHAVDFFKSPPNGRKRRRRFFGGPHQCLRPERVQSR